MGAICICGHRRGRHDDDGMCMVRNCSCEMMQLKKEEITIWNRLHYKNAYFIMELKQTWCRRCKRVMACTIVADAMKIPEDRFIPSLEIGRGNLLNCRAYQELPTRKQTKKEKQSNNEENDIFKDTRFETMGEYVVRQGKWLWDK
jgi:hypothetical protein